MSRNRKIRLIFKSFQKNFSTTDRLPARCLKPLPMPPTAPGEVLLVYFVLLGAVWRYNGLLVSGSIWWGQIREIQSAESIFLQY